MKISAHRALVLDGLALAPRGVLYPLEQTFDLAEVAVLRANCARRVSWSVLFLKAYSIVASRVPELRQEFRRWPTARLFQQSENVAMLVVNRRFENEDRICWARFERSEEQSLGDLQTALDEYQNHPVEQIFKKQVRLSRMPTVVRRLLWWCNLNLAGVKRAKRMGTFTISSLAGQATVNRFHQTLLTTSLSYGPLDEQGRALVSLICDHRVLDGAVAARALTQLQSVMQDEIAAELHTLQRRDLVAA